MRFQEFVNAFAEKTFSCIVFWAFLGLGAAFLAYASIASLW